MTTGKQTQSDRPSLENTTTTARSEEDSDLTSSLLMAPSRELEMPLLPPEDADADDEDSDPQEPDVALAFSPSTPCWARYGIPLWALVTHGIFLCGQLAPMWSLSLTEDVDVWANATSRTSQMTYDALGFKHHAVHWSLQGDRIVKTLTYPSSIEELWKAAGMPGLVLPRTAAILLILCSGIWPHVKLLLLNRVWLSSTYNKSPSTNHEQPSRQRALYWLSFLGKWSLSDVLVVCVMLGILNMEWDVYPDDIKNGVTDELPLLLSMVHAVYSSTELCDQLLHVDCSHAKKIKTITKCKACRATINEAFSHPSYAQTTGKKIMEGIATSGGGYVRLQVVGQVGIYFFCTAVILSIVLSVVVDIMDAKSRSYYTSLTTSSTTSSTTTTTMILRDDEDNPESSENDLQLQEEFHDEQQPLNEEEEDGLEDVVEIDEEGNDLELQDLSPSSRPRGSSYSRGNNRRRAKDEEELSFWDGISLVMSILVAIVVSGASFVPTMQREAVGAVPYLIKKVIGVDWERSYSLFSLMKTTGSAGQWDYLLMSTIALFLIVGPILRVVLIILRYTIKLFCWCCCSSSTLSAYTRHLKTCIKFAGAFCAWEVFCCAAIMVGFLMAPTTNTIFPRKKCRMVLKAEASLPDDYPRHEHCFQVDYDFLPTFWLLLAGGGVMLLLLAQIATYKKATKADNWIGQSDHYHRRRLSSGISGVTEVSTAGISLHPVSESGDASASSTSLLTTEET